MVDRRSFLKGLGAATTVPLVPKEQAAGSTDMAFDPARKPQRAVFQQQVYFNFDGNGEAYTPPVKEKIK
jgi:hypothetical protein